MWVLPDGDGLAAELVAAIHAGDVPVLRRLLRANPALATARIRRSSGPGRAELRSLLHVATDWPGNYPRVAETIGVLVEAGADVNARFVGPHGETPLHWAASSDDVAALDALLDHAADIEASGAVIGGGTPVANAVAFGQWKAANRLVERGAKTNLWQSAALGLTERVMADLEGDPGPAQKEITKAFWLACHGGERDTAGILYARGADPDWIGFDGLAPIDAAQRSKAHELVAWLHAIGAKSSGAGRPGG